MAHSLPPYGVAIHDAIASGDVGQMQKVAADAESYLKEYGDISDGLHKLNAAIESLGGAGSRPSPRPIPLYGVPIYGAIESGDIDRMKAMAAQAEDYLKQVDEVRAALGDLKKSMGS